MLFRFYLILFLICSCSPKAKFNRLIKKYPELISSNIVLIKDTLIKKDTLILLQRIDSFIIKKDTIINTKNFYIEKNNEVLKIITKKDTVYFIDTFFYEKKIPVPFIKNEAGTWQKFKYFWLSFWVFLGIFLFIRYLFKYYF
jgi:hypothetical protein